MAQKSNIQWTDASWNPITGCTKVSKGCKYCYAETWAKRHFGEFSKDKARKFTQVQRHEDKLLIPLKWKKPLKIFVNSMSDLFHEKVPFEFIDKVFAVMALCEDHTFQILTKREDRMFEYFANYYRDSFIEANAQRIYHKVYGKDSNVWTAIHLPLKNVWMGVSVEDQENLIKRLPKLLQVPAAIRWLSLEPLLAPITFLDEGGLGVVFENLLTGLRPFENNLGTPIDWVVIGAESGFHAREMKTEWALDIINECKYSQVPVT